MKIRVKEEQGLLESMFGNHSEVQCVVDRYPTHIEGTYTVTILLDAVPGKSVTYRDVTADEIEFVKSV